MDYSVLLNNPIASVYGVAATLAPNDSSADVALTAVDMTDGVEVSLESEAQLHTVRPAAVLRMAELTENSITLSQLDGGTLTLNGEIWRIESHVVKRTPNGQSDGQVYLFLMDESA